MVNQPTPQNDWGKWVLPSAIGATLAFLAFLGTQALQTNSRLTDIEATIREGRQERVQQVEDLRRRLDRLEGDFYDPRGRQ